MISIKFHRLSPTQFLVAGYLIVIILGTVLLSMPIATVPGGKTNTLDALFTATSATAVTGLIVKNTAIHWSFFGKFVIMLLIQIGGLGFMTTSTLVMMLLGRRINFRERMIIKEELNAQSFSGVIRTVKYIVMITFGVEAVGAILLFFRFLPQMEPGKALFFGVFHSISAFNNAGFDISGNSLENFVGDWYIVIVITGLFIIGGIGFAVISELYNHRKLKKFSLHTKVVLTMTIALILLGTLVVFILEYNNPDTLGDLSLSGKVAAAYFQGVTPRTAGFNTVPFGNLTRATLFFLSILMFIGASPGSTGGGVKTTTFGTLFAVFWALARNKEDVELHYRRLSHTTIFKAVSVVLISILVVILVIMVLTITEDAPFLDIYFEAISAFGTVGLSTGITGSLSSLGRLVIIVTMFIGRVGPMTLAVAIGENQNHAHIRYPEEEMMIG